MNFNTIQRLIVKEFTDAGYKPHQIAGVLSAIKNESSFNSRVVGDTGRSTGLFQFNGPRRQALVRMFGRDANTPLAQIRYALHELNTTERHAGDMLRSAADPTQAAIAMNNFERFSAGGGYKGGREANERIRDAQSFAGMLNQTSPTNVEDHIARSLSEFEQPEGTFDMASAAPKIKPRVPRGKVKANMAKSVTGDAARNGGKTTPDNATEAAILNNVPGLLAPDMEANVKRALGNSSVGNQSARPDKGTSVAPYKQGEVQPKETNLPAADDASFDARYAGVPSTQISSGPPQLQSAAATIAAGLGIPMAAVVVPDPQKQQQPAQAAQADPVAAGVQQQMQAAPQVSPETEAFAQKIMQAIMGDPQTAQAADDVAHRVASNVAANDAQSNAGVPMPQPAPRQQMAAQQQMQATQNQRAAADQGATGDSPEMMYAVNADNGAGGNALMQAFMQSMMK